ncbi:hypothetical protein ACSVIJ_04395 [Pseudomonas sp. NCHU5208]|uniref:hypothetical protein n=1 Tax=unclassified Pseudomonas TaxID=196821 RepID=UPI003F9C7538
MFVYLAIAAVAFILGTGVSNYELWGGWTWWQGLVCGGVIGFVWHANRLAAAVLGFIGFLSLPLILIGVGDAGLPNASRSFFNGMSMALPLGYAVGAWWTWDVFRPKLLLLAEAQNVGWLVRMLGGR